MKHSLILILFVLSANCNAKMKHAHSRNVPSEEQCIMSAVIYEAGGESSVGMKSVFTVVKNRAIIRHMSYCQVVSEPSQFSWRNKKPMKKMTKQLRELMQELEEMDDVISVDVEYFYSAKIKKPAWARKLKYVGRIGGHKFYEEKLKEN